GCGLCRPGCRAGNFRRLPLTGYQFALRAGMNLSAISNHSSFAKVLRLPLKLIPSGTQVTVRGGCLKGKKWIVGSHTHGCWLGSYEREKQILFATRVTKGDVVFDIGAN